MSTSVAQQRLRAMDRRVISLVREDPRFDTIRLQAKMLVPGVGNILSKIVVVGEAPGEEEDRTGLPFVGPAGVFLSELLEIAGLSREAVWITNLIKYRPVDSLGRNRRPYSKERAAGRYYLRRELDVIKPELVVLCGRSVLSVVRQGVSVLEAHGVPFQMQTPGRTYYPVIHPSACLQGDPEWAEWTREDFRKIPGILIGI